MSNKSRLIILLASLAIIGVYFFPVWSIYLIAPQYPEGLSMQIWLNKLSGQVEIINGLNHYIGMRTINEEMFPELKILVYIVGFIIVYGIAVAIWGNRKFLFSYIILFILFGAAAIYDFYLWGYDYGHNLDPTAPIQVPGLTYQPPVIGHKKLLNFDAFSYPDTGAWIIIIAAILTIGVWAYEIYKSKKSKHLMKSRKVQLALLAMVIFYTGCKPEAEKIIVGKDQCAECKMTVMDERFGGEIVSKKGKVFKFDDVHCMGQFMKKRSVEMKDIYQTLVVDYAGSHEFIKVNSAHFVVGSKLKSPMGSNAAAFANEQEAKQMAESIDGKFTNWATLYNVLVK